MYRFFKIFFSTAVLFLTIFALAAAAPGESVYSDEQLSEITLKTLKILASKHYRQLEFSPKFAGDHFDLYVKSLDGSKVFFTAEDIKSFNADPQKLLDALLKGDNTMAFAVYNRFLARHKEYRKFAEKMLRSKLDFSEDETFISDRSKLPYCKNDAELKELWRKRLKNEVLFYQLFDRAIKESSDPEDKKALDDAKRWNAGTPVSKVLKRLRDVSNAVEKRSKVDILGIYLNALARVYGPHSNFMAPRTAKDFDIGMSLSLTWIGATLTSDNGFIKVVSLVPGGPAAKDGRLKVNDRIVAVTQETVQLSMLLICRSMKLSSISAARKNPK